MSGRARRRRGLVLLALALASGGLAASQVGERVRAVEARVGPLVPVVVAARDLPADAELAADAVDGGEVPEGYVPPDAIGPGEAHAERRTAVPIRAGTILTAAHLQGGARVGAPGGATLRPGERAVEVAAAGGEALAAATPGTRVDVVVSTDNAAGHGSTFIALENVELLGLRPSTDPTAVAPPDEDTPAATALATLRVSARQAVYLTAVQSFGRELRLLVRPPGDRGRTGAVEVGANEL